MKNSNLYIHFKRSLVLFGFGLVLLPALESCKKKGCTDSEAINFDAAAEKEDGSCIVLVKGCTDPKSLTYDPAAQISDGSCVYQTNALILDFDHWVGNQNLVLHEFNYTNAAGNNYSVEQIRYLISSVTLYNVDGTTYTDSTFHYRDVTDESTRSFVLSDVPTGHYTKISFVFGVDSARNITGGLPNESRFNGMEWPDMMGGGYHYMKLEGKYIDSTQNEANYNIHTGATKTSTGVIFHDIYYEFDHLSFQMDQDIWRIQVKMDINQWFSYPLVYNIEDFGSAIMGDSLAQEVLETNGEAVFSTGYLFRQ